MSDKASRPLWWWLAASVTAALCLVGLLSIALLACAGYLKAFANGPDVVASVESPDGNYTAYVVEQPSIDPPNQSLYVERQDKVHFMRIAELAEDVDSIRQIMWSPDSRVVVFHSRDYLTVTRVSDWLTVRASLGREWTRSKPDRVATFSSGGGDKMVATVEFPETDCVAYQLEGDERTYTVRLDAASGS